MKISATQYAKSLYDSVVGKSEKEIKVALRNFVVLLGRNRELNKLEEIINIFTEIWDREHGEIAARLISARELGPTAREIINGYLREKTGAKKIKLEEEIDKKLIGGFVLRYSSKVVDGSLRTSLEELKNKISN
jgi:F-type H+-transporting ATPase subunit delta